MTTTTATMPALPVQLSEKDRHAILDNVLAALRKRFYSPEKLNGEWQAAVDRHRPIIESAVTADAFEQSMSDLLAELHTSHLGFFHNTGRRASSRAALSATYLADETPYGNRWIFQDVHSGGAAALAGIVPGNILLKVDAPGDRSTRASGFSDGETDKRRDCRQRRQTTDCVCGRGPPKRQETPFHRADARRGASPRKRDGLPESCDVSGYGGS